MVKADLPCITERQLNWLRDSLVAVHATWVQPRSPVANATAGCFVIDEARARAIEIFSGNGGSANFDGNRGVELDLGEEPPEDVLRQCISLALT